MRIFRARPCRAAAPGLVLIVCLVIVGCADRGIGDSGSADDTSQRAAESASLRPGVPGGPDTTCVRFGRLFLSVDTRTDRSAADARIRAAQAAGSIGLQQQMIDGLRSPPRDLDWSERASRDVRIEVTPIPYAGGALPADSPSRAYRAVSFELTEVTPDGARRSLSGLGTIFCTLVRVEADYGWLVDEVQLSGGFG